MKIIVTGASGFIGVPIIKQLAGKGHQILALSRSDRESLPGESITWVKANLDKPDSYKTAVESFSTDTLIHLAWQDIPDYSYIKSLKNLNQSLDLINLVMSVGSCKKIIAAGSCFEFNKLLGQCRESDIGSPNNDFSWAKHSLRAWLEMKCNQQGVTMGWMRIFYVYGPGQRPGALIPTILDYLDKGEVPPIRTPKNANDFIFVEDVVEGFLSAIDREFPSGIFNLGSETSTSVLEVCRKAERVVCDSDSVFKQLQQKTSETESQVDFWADSSRSREFLGWSPKVNLSEGIRKTWSNLQKT